MIWLTLAESATATRCTDPRILAAIAIAAAFAGLLAILGVIFAPSLVARRLPPGDARRGPTLAAQATAASCAAIALGLFAILAVAYFAGALRLCR